MSPIAEDEGLVLPTWANVARLTASSTPLQAVEVAKARARKDGDVNPTLLSTLRQAQAKLSATEVAALTPYFA